MNSDAEMRQAMEHLAYQIDRLAALLDEVVTLTRAGVPISAQTIDRYPGMLVHDRRRSAVRNMERAGLSRSVATQFTGHKTEAVYRRYAITCEADLREGAERLNSSVDRRGSRADGTTR